MEEKNNNEQQQEREPMSPFCEALMSATESLIELRRPDDVALIMCSDGRTMSTRQGGNVVAARRMIYGKMLADAHFAELILEVAAAYSLRQFRGNEEAVGPADNAQQAEIKPLN